MLAQVVRFVHLFKRGITESPLEELQQLSLIAQLRSGLGPELRWPPSELSATRSGGSITISHVPMA